MSNLKLGLCQMKVTDSEQENLKKAVEMLEICAQNDVNIAVLPEMFSCPYDTNSFTIYAEDLENSEVYQSFQVQPSIIICM